MAVVGRTESPTAIRVGKDYWESEEKKQSKKLHGALASHAGLNE